MIRDVLKEQPLEEWHYLDQRVIDKAVSQYGNVNPHLVWFDKCGQF